MEVKTEKSGSATIVHVHGRLDSVTAKAFEEQMTQLIDGGENRLVLDLSQMDYVSSAGLRALLMANRKIVSAGGKIALCEATPSVKEVLEISGFVSLFTICASREEALAHVQN